jgi:type IV pilus assembly protein PilA
MFCFKCGATMPDTATACPQCGALAQNAPSPLQPAAGATAPGPGLPTSPRPMMSAPVTPAGYGQEAQTDGKATASMIFGILSITCFWIFAGIPAVILGHMAKSNIAKSMGRLKGDGMATAGLIMGYLSIVVGIIPIMIIAAIAIPSLMRSRMVADTSAAVSTVRTVNTAQVVYLTNYPNAGYGKSLEVLGPGWPPVDCAKSSNVTAEHACLIDGSLGCGFSTWCVKGGYRFSLKGICGADGVCSDYVITAAPITSTAGTKSFCSTSNAVIRYRIGSPPRSPLATAEECGSWQAVQ